MIGCPECQEEFGTEFGLSVHYGKIHESFIRVCEECGKKFRRNNGQPEQEYCSRSCSAAANGRAQRKEYAQFSLDSGKYPKWYTDSNLVAVHQLLVVTNGADPYKVFGNRGYNVDHINGCKIDNRPSNLQVLTLEKHGKKDGGKSLGGDHMEKLRLLENIYEYVDMEADKVVEVSDIA